MTERNVEVLVIDPLPDATMARIVAIDPVIRVQDARGWFDSEMRATWPPWAVQRYMSGREGAPSQKEDRDRVLASAEVILGGWPFPLDLRSRAPRLRWFHQRPAGASNLLRGDLWGSDVLVTTSRAHGNTGPMAEYVLACFLYFARGLHRAALDRQQQQFDHRAYKPIIVAGKTVCVVGAGGIGQAVGQLCAGAGMRVVGTRRDAAAGRSLPAGFEHVGPADELHTLLRESTFVAVCCPWTAETTHLIGRDAFAAMQPGTVLVNVARGEIVDEEALLAALDAGTLRGAGLDVYDGENERAPDSLMWQDPRLLITPHVSGGTDVPRARAIDLFCENLRYYLDDKPLKNLIDWQRGY